MPRLSWSGVEINVTRLLPNVMPREVRRMPRPDVEMPKFPTQPYNWFAERADYAEVMGGPEEITLLRLPV